MSNLKELHTGIDQAIFNVFHRKITMEYALAHFPNPYEQNTEIIATGFQSITDTLPHAQPDAYFHESRTVELVLRTKEIFPATLIYEAVRYPETARASLFLMHGIETIARRNWNIYRRDTPFHHTEIGHSSPREIHVGEHLGISSSLYTTPKWEGNGFAIPLLRQSDAVCMDLATRYLREYADLPVLAYISDSAHGRKLNRDKWTSDRSRDIDYIEYEPEEFVKRYR